jgi:polar amino acid transport system permease protein
LEVGKSRLVPFTSRLSRWPWWALAIALLGVIFAWAMATDADYERIFGAISAGIIVTILVTVISYIIALIMGLVLALGRVSTNIFAYQISTFYIEIVRGVPTLILLLYIAFVGLPAFVDLINALGTRLLDANILPGFANIIATLRNRDVGDEFRIVVALSIAYSAFLAEIFRAGIESVDHGQMEAARALGMTYWQAMRHIILRQAIRRVLPPLGNDFIAMLKDSSLAWVLGIGDISGLGKRYESSTFLTLQTYNVVAYLYLAMTLLLSMGVKWIERRMARERIA